MKRTFVLLAALCIAVGCSKPAATPSAPATTSLPPEAAKQIIADAMAQGNPPGVPVKEGVAELDSSNTIIGFKGTKPDGTVHLGGFRQLTGKVEVDTASSAIKQLHVDIQTDSLWSDTDRLTTHLKSPDFFNVREIPTLSFTSTGVQAGTITGELTMLGKTQEISLPLTTKVQDTGVIIEGQFTIDRTAWGMTFGEGQVDKEVTVSVTVGKSSSAATPGQADSAGAGGPGAGAPGGGNFNPAAIFQRQDANGDGKLSGDELTDRMRDGLSQLDSDGDGALSQAELMAGGRGAPGNN